MAKISTWDFIKKIQEMRQAQKDYFKTRDQSILRHSKQLEQEVDQIIEKTLKVKEQRPENNIPADAEMS